MIAYQRSFLDLFMEWRIQPLSVRHNPLKAMSREEIGAMLESEGCILSDLAKNESYRWFIQYEDAVVASLGFCTFRSSLSPILQRVGGFFECLHPERGR